MNKTYNIQFSQTSTFEVDIEASSEDEAIELLKSGDFDKLVLVDTEEPYILNIL